MNELNVTDEQAASLKLAAERAYKLATSDEARERVKQWLDEVEQAAANGKPFPYPLEGRPQREAALLTAVIKRNAADVERGRKVAHAVSKGGKARSRQQSGDYAAEVVEYMQANRDKTFTHACRVVSCTHKVSVEAVRKAYRAVHPKK